MVGLLLVVLITLCRKATAHQDDKASVVTQGWKIVMMGLFIIYPSVSSTILRMMHCTENIAGKHYLYADWRIVCYEDDWFTYLLIALVALVVYPIGVPFMYWYFLYTNRDALHDEDHPDHAQVSARFNFIYRQYEPEAWYWEVHSSCATQPSADISPCDRS